MTEAEKVREIENTVDVLNNHLLALYQLVDDLADELIKKEPNIDPIRRRVKSQIAVLKALKMLRY